MRHVSAAVSSTAPAHTPRGYALAQVNRPTEYKALRQAAQTPAPPPDQLTGFDSILTAHANGDRHGLSLLGHAAARLAGGTAR
jgi:hypothetical protein